MKKKEREETYTWCTHLAEPAPTGKYRVVMAACWKRYRDLGAESVELGTLFVRVKYVGRKYGRKLSCGEYMVNERTRTYFFGPPLCWGDKVRLHYQATEVVK